MSKKHGRKQELYGRRSRRFSTSLYCSLFVTQKLRVDELIKIKISLNAFEEFFCSTRVGSFCLDQSVYGNCLERRVWVAKARRNQCRLKSSSQLSDQLILLFLSVNILSFLQPLIVAAKQIQSAWRIDVSKMFQDSFRRFFLDYHQHGHDNALNDAILSKALSGALREPFGGQFSLNTLRWRLECGVLSLR